MRASGRPPLAPLAITCAAALLFAGCLPIPHTLTVSPAISGTLHRADGTPAAGVPVAVSPSFADSTCTRATQRTTTDAAGRFELARTRRREAWMALLMERLLCYSVCGGPSGGDPFYQSCSIRSVPPAESAACAESTSSPSGGAPRTTCVVTDPRGRGHPTEDR